MADQSKGFWTSARRPFFRGLAALLPTILTIAVIVLVYSFITGKMVVPIRNAFVRFLINRFGEQPPIRLELDPTNWMVKLIGVAIFLVIILAIYFVGFFATSFVGRKIWGGFEGFWTRFPFIKQIYPYAKQITDFVLSEKRRKFTHVVAFEYPRKGIYSIGFLTGEGMRQINESAGTRMVSVFIPSSPTPFTGYTLSVPYDEIIPLAITVDQAIRYTVSGGVITPIGQDVGEQTRTIVESHFMKDHENTDAHTGKAEPAAPQDETKEG